MASWRPPCLDSRPLLTGNEVCDDTALVGILFLPLSFSFLSRPLTSLPRGLGVGVGSLVVHKAASVNLLLSTNLICVFVSSVNERQCRIEIESTMNLSSLEHGAQDPRTRSWRRRRRAGVWGFLRNQIRCRPFDHLPVSGISDGRAGGGVMSDGESPTGCTPSTTCCRPSLVITLMQPVLVTFSRDAEIVPWRKWRCWLCCSAQDGLYWSARRQLLDGPPGCRGRIWGLYLGKRWGGGTLLGIGKAP